MRIEPMRFSRWQMTKLCWQIAWEDRREIGIIPALQIFVYAPFIVRSLTVEVTPVGEGWRA